MKQFISILFIAFIAFTASAQKDVTKFMGIPVDGTKAEMIQKLKAKGFTSSSYDRDVLEGEFNGHDVYIHIVTNNNIVSRIMVTDKNNIGETDIKIRFNRLCQQFKNNKNYVDDDNTTKKFFIPEDEDLSYNITVNNKRYEAVFYQVPDTIGLRNKAQTMLREKYTPQQLENPTEEMKEYASSYIWGIIEMKTVWFMISESYGKYYISMYYDNEYNRSNGEDL